MIQEFIKAFLLIFVSEMGDKTQILAMTCAARYNVKQVLIGIFIGVLLNHGIAIILGCNLCNFISLDILQVAAGFIFIIFGFITLLQKDNGDINQNHSKFGPVLTVASAFFIGELGDKTQLSAMTLSIDAIYPVIILTGTVLAMLVTGAIGVFIGKKIGNSISQTTIRIISAIVFIIFGTVKLFNSFEYFSGNYQIQAIFIIIIGAASAFIISKILRAKNKRSKYEFRTNQNKNKRK